MSLYTSSSRPKINVQNTASIALSLLNNILTGVLTIATLNAATVASGDLVAIADINDSNNIKKVTAQSIADLGGAGGGTDIIQVQVFS